MRFILAIIAILTITCNKLHMPVPPDITYNRTGCCFSMYTAFEFDNNKAVTVDLKESNLNLNTSLQLYRIQDYPADIKVKYYTNANHPDSNYFFFCTDMLDPPIGHNKVWIAVSGTIMASVSKPKPQRQRCEDYYGSLQLLNARFTDGARDTTILKLQVSNKRYNACIP